MERESASSRESYSWLARVSKSPGRSFKFSAPKLLPRGSSSVGSWQTHGGSELEPLFAHTCIIDIRWLLRFAKGEASFVPSTSYPSPRAVPAWQDVPKDAVVQLELLKTCKLDYNALPILVLSYGWASAEHPDPYGEHLQRLLPILESIVSYCEQVDCETWGVMWDFLALPQRGRTTGYDAAADDRTPAQLATFRAGLGDINVWYGHPHTTSLLLNLPMPEGATNQTDYDERGWCIFERRLSAVVKDNDCFLHLSSLSGRTSYWPGLRAECAAARPAPMLPAAFEALMRRGVADRSIHFTNGKDATQVVIPQYAVGFDRLMHNAVEFDLRDLEWGDAEAVAFAAALTYAHGRGGLRHVQKVNLVRNRIGDDGMRALADAIRAGAMPTLPNKKGMVIAFNPASKSAQSELRAALRQRGKSRARGAS